jgi:hypothetical protein
MKPEEIEITEATREIAESLRRPEEALEETLTRLALAFRTSGLMSYDPTKTRRKTGVERSEQGGAA